MKFIPDVVTRSVATQAFKMQGNAPKLLFVGGVASMVGSTVLACRATLKMEELMTETKSDLQVAKSLQHREYSEKDRQQDVAVIYTRSILKVGRLYLPAVGLGVAGIGMLTKSHNMLQERNAALAAAYYAVDKAFNRYRDRVVERYGEDVDTEFRYDLTEVEATDSKGKKVKAWKASEMSESMYARFFDQYSPNWCKEPEYNLVFLRAQQNYANDLLKARGHVFLNEVYDMLGLERSRAGAVVGWIISEEGDNFIDFGIWSADSEMSRHFVNGREGSILLDFNVDGVVWDKIKESERGERIQWQS
jgi:hypothetical protein